MGGVDADIRGTEIDEFHLINYCILAPTIELMALETLLLTENKSKMTTKAQLESDLHLQ